MKNQTTATATAPQSLAQVFAQGIAQGLMDLEYLRRYHAILGELLSEETMKDEPREFHVHEWSAARSVVTQAIVAMQNA